VIFPERELTSSALWLVEMSVIAIMGLQEGTVRVTTTEVIFRENESEMVTVETKGENREEITESKFSATVGKTDLSVNGGVILGGRALRESFLFFLSLFLM
jgi:hypothetical protein